MAATFPISPTNGQTANVNNIVYQYSTATGSWTRVLTPVSGIANGTSSISIATAEGNANVTINGVSNVAVFTATGFNVTGNISATGSVTATQITTSAIPLVLNDISNQCDGGKTVFPLRVDQANVTSANITDSKNLQVVVSGATLSPYITQLTYPWLTPYDSYPGYRVVTTSTSANLIIYNAPAIGSQVTLTIINKSAAIQTRKYPFSATTIALGD